MSVECGIQMTFYWVFRNALACYVSSTDVHAGLQIDTSDPLYGSNQCKQFEKSRFFEIRVALFIFSGPHWADKILRFGFHIQWNLSKSNLPETNFFVRNRQVSSLYRLNLERWPALELYLKLGLHIISDYSAFDLDRLHCTCYSRWRETCSVLLWRAIHVI